MSGTLFAGTLWNGEILVRNIPATGGGASVVVNGAGTITASMKLPLVDPETGVKIAFADLIIPGRCFLGYEEDGKIINAGPIWTDQFFNDTGTFTVSAAGLWSYWDHRFVIPLLDDADEGDTPRNKTTKYTGLSLRTIAKRLVQQAQSWTNGSVPVVFESDIPGPNQREYLGSDLHKVGEKLTQLSGVIDGPDIAFRPRFKSDPRFIEWVMMTGSPELTRDTMATRVNLVEDSGVLSTGFGVSGYYAIASIVAGADPTYNAAKVVTSLTTLREGMFYVSPNIKGPGTFTISANVKGPAGVSARFAGRTDTSEGMGQVTFVMTGDWQRVGTTFTLSSAAASVGMQFILDTPASGKTLLMSRLQVEAVPAPDYTWIYGGAPNCYWAGATNASQSVKVQITSAPDHIWDLTVPTPNAKGVQIVRNATHLTTDSYWVGAYQEDDRKPIMAKSYDSTLPSNGFLRFEDDAMQTSITSQGVLQSHADESTFLGKYHEQTWLFEANKMVAPMLTEYNEGDYASIIFKNNARLADGRYRLRIISYSVAIDSSFVSIACAPERVRA